MSETPTSTSWAGIAVVLLASFTAFITAWQALNGNDAQQNARLANIERVLCATDDKVRRDACRMAGVRPS